MKSVNLERGVATGVLLGFISLGVLCAIFMAISAWAVGERSTYKNKSDQLVATAVEQNTAKVKSEMEKTFAEKEKSPLKTFVGPEEYGSIKITHPKTWSIYAVKGESSQPLDVYMDNGFVQSTQSTGATYALRVQVTSQSYADVLNEFSNSTSDGGAKVSPFKLPKNEKIIGSRIEGTVDDQKKGVMVVLPLRDRAIKVWTESDKYKTDFDEIIMKNFIFIP